MCKKNSQVSIWSLFRAFSCLLSCTDNFDHNSLQFTQKLLLKLEPQMNTKQTLKISKIKKTDRSERCSKSLMDLLVPKYSNVEFLFYSILKILLN